MPGSSELSGALDPYHYQQVTHYSSNVSPIYDQHARISASTTGNIPHQQSFVPHRSELADAIIPAAVSPSTPGRNSPRKRPRQPSSDKVQLLKGLIHSIATYKEAVEQEKKRRLLWEREREAKYISRQAELEKQVVELERELEALKARFGVSDERISQYVRESTGSVPSDSSRFPGESILLFDPINKTSLPDVSDDPFSPSMSQNSPGNPSDQEPAKVRSHRGMRAQSIQATMRIHILRCMGLEHDRELPPSHNEAVKLPPTQPVRFVWGQTIKKSTHNSRMKNRVISDLIANKDLYPLIPPQVFTDAKLDGIFDQAFTTFRQKYASQQGLKADSRNRADMKARRARRLSRKKTKLANRIATRDKLETFKNSAFDFAFKLECMSSEESSDGESDAAETDRPSGRALRIRRLAWRSTRLQELFRTIDEYEQFDRETKPKRGVGRKDRRMGTPKDGNPPPPKGTPQWMVKKNWLRLASAVQSQVTSLVSPNDESAASALSMLGDESEDEGEEVRGPPLQLDYSRSRMPAPDFPLESLPPVMEDVYRQAQYIYAQHDAWAEPMSGYVDLSQFSSPVMQAYPS